MNQQPRQRQQALTVLGSAIASAAATATLLFLGLPAAPPLERTPAAEEISALRREVNALRDELAARPAALPAPVVAERVADLESGRLHEELADRCNELVSRCDDLERRVAELNARLATTAFNPAGDSVWIPASGDEMKEGDGRVPMYGFVKRERTDVNAALFATVKQVNAYEVELRAHRFVWGSRM
jgi:hypothetical protein